MRVDPDILDNWKYRNLVKLSGFEYPIVWLIRLWGNCQNRRSSHFPADANQIVQICRYDGPANDGTFVQWLIDSGFLDNVSGQYVVHQWDEYNKRLVHNWTAGAKGGRPADIIRRKYETISVNDTTAPVRKMF